LIPKLLINMQQTYENYEYDNNVSCHNGVDNGNNDNNYNCDDLHYCQQYNKHYNFVNQSSQQVTNKNHNDNNKNVNNTHKIRDIINNRYVIEKQLAEALQGEILLSFDLLNNNQPVIVKKVEKKLVEKRISRKGNFIHENIFNEVNVMLRLNEKTKNHSTHGFVRLLDFMEDDRYYYMVEEYGGIDFFDFVVAQQKEILNNNDNTLYNKWKINVQKYMYSMLTTVDIIHNIGKMAHCDLSLENALIDVKTNEIKIIDFGCVFDSEEPHNNKSFIDNRRKGKNRYMAPEVYNCVEYDCRKADIFSMGVMFFILLFGIPLFEVPKEHDNGFLILKRGQLLDALHNVNKFHLLTVEEYELLTAMLQINPNARPCASSLLQYSYFSKNICNQQNLLCALNANNYRSLLMQTQSLSTSQIQNQNKIENDNEYKKTTVQSQLQTQLQSQSPSPSLSPNLI